MIEPIRLPAINAPSTAERVVQLRNELCRIVEDVNRQNADFDRRLKKIEERSKEQ